MGSNAVERRALKSNIGMMIRFINLMDERRSLGSSDSPRAMAVLEQLAGEILRAAQAGRDVQAAQAELRRLGAVFGLRFDLAQPEPRVTAGWDQHLQRFSD